LNAQEARILAKIPRLYWYLIWGLSASKNQTERSLKQMNQHKLKALIAAGVFSTALMAGKAYADDATSSMPKSDKKATHKHMKGHSCKGQNSCKGKGGCKTGDQGCKGKNSCKGKGGCSTGDYKGKADKMEAPSAAGDKASDKHGCSGKNGCAGK
jgi:hypothetical protein